MDTTGGTFDTLKDERPMTRNTPLVLIQCDHFSYEPYPEALEAERVRLRSEGWRAVTAGVKYQIVGAPYRVEYWGYK